MEVDRWTGQRANLLRVAYREVFAEVSDEKFALEVLGVSPGTLYKWQREPGSEPRPATQRLLKDFYERAPDKVRERFWKLLSEADDPLTKSADVSERRGRRGVTSEVGELLDQSVRESRLFLALHPDSIDLDQLHQSGADLGIAYLASPALPMLDQANALRSELTRRLTSGAYRPHELADLYVTLGRVSGVLAYAALDLGNSRAAIVHGQAAYHLADLADNDELRAWARGTQSLIARFDWDFARAQWFLENGMRHAGSGTSETRLLCGMAQVAANHGNTQRALDLLEDAARARSDVKRDTVEGLFGFSPAKEAYYSGSALMWLPEKKPLRIASERAATAIDMWKREPIEQRSLDDEALAHLYHATAELRLGELDAAMDAARRVIELPEERQISWIGKRIDNLVTILERDRRYADSRAAAAARDELRPYGSGAGITDNG